MANPNNGKIQSMIAMQQTQLVSKDLSNSPTRATAQQHNQNGQSGRGVAIDGVYDPNACAGCGEQLKEGQALIALDRQWHISCFRFVEGHLFKFFELLILFVYIFFSSVSCKNCNSILNGEYMGKDGVPYCEKCYQKLFGVKCAYCNRYISGKVLQAGDNHHFHPTCARCTKCGINSYLQISNNIHPH